MYDTYQDVQDELIDYYVKPNELPLNKHLVLLLNNLHQSLLEATIVEKQHDLDNSSGPIGQASIIEIAMTAKLENLNKHLFNICQNIPID